MNRLARIAAAAIAALFVLPLLAEQAPAIDRTGVINPTNSNPAGLIGSPNGDPAGIIDTPSIAALDARNGFRGAKFGTPLAEFKNLRLIEDGYWKFFRKTDEPLTFGGGAITEVGYGFYREELGAVILKAAGSNCDLVLEGLKASYGQPAQPDPTQKNYVWDGQKVSLSFDNSQSPKGCYATFISVTEHEKAFEDEEMAARTVDPLDKTTAPK